MIETLGLNKIFGSVHAVKNVSLSIGKQEIHGLVGPDGAGKTTLMRMLCGILTPSKGTISIGNTNLGYMPQRFSLYGDLTVMENIDFFGRLYGMDRKTLVSTADNMLDITNLKEFKSRFADNLSGGMKQKLALTCALLSKPSLIILDEPTFGVDPESRREFWRILYQLNNEGLTILVSTPNMDEAELCHRISFIESGQIITSDSPENLKRNFKYKVFELKVDDYNLDYILKLEQVFDAEMFGENFRLIAYDHPNVKKILSDQFAESGHHIDLTTVSPSMEDVFIGLARKEAS